MEIHDPPPDMWGKLSPNEYRVMKCRCGFEADRDVIGSWNIRLRALKMWGASVPPESPSIKPETGRLAVAKVIKVTEIAVNQNGNHKYI